jgi:nucleoid-associated protein YgaU
MATDLDIAMHWPKWYEANRSIIGADPGLLQPGQVLYPPAP